MTNDGIALLEPPEKGSDVDLPREMPGAVAGKLIKPEVEGLRGADISKSQVSRLCQEIDERVQVFLTRPIDGTWPYLWLDAT